MQQQRQIRNFMFFIPFYGQIVFRNYFWMPSGRIIKWNGQLYMNFREENNRLIKYVLGKCVYQSVLGKIEGKMRQKNIISYRNYAKL